MASVVVLGGSGGIGTVAVKALVALEAFDEVVIADLRADAAEGFAASFGKPNVRGCAVDASSHESLVSVMRGARVVLNCVGRSTSSGRPHWPPRLRQASTT